MTAFSEELYVKLGAYVDGELNPSDRSEIEALIASDPSVASEVEALLGLNDDLKSAFDSLLDKPVPEDIRLPTAPPMPANDNRAPIFSLAASLLLGAVIGAGLAWSWLQGAAQQSVQIAAARSWLGEVAEYHQVYARQERHLVEVPASEKDHIEDWLGKEIGVEFQVPDLSSAGWEFQGARLLVAAGKPVAQLLYTNSEGQVIALCALHNVTGEPASVTPRSFGDVHMATWKDQDGSFAIIGDDQAQLPALANLAAPLI